VILNIYLKLLTIKPYNDHSIKDTYVLFWLKKQIFSKLGTNTFLLLIQIGKVIQMLWYVGQIKTDQTL
jgi:hypothetical protein